MDWSYVQEIIPRFVQAALVTLRLSAWGVSLSLLLGLAVALVTSYRVRPMTGDTVLPSNKNPGSTVFRIGPLNVGPSSRPMISIHLATRFRVKRTALPAVRLY